MKENDSFFEDNNSFLVKRFEDLLASGSAGFFDVDEFEDIFDHYLRGGNLKKAMKAVRMARKQHPMSFEFVLKEAEVLVNSGKPDKALRLIADIEDLEAMNPDLHLLKASIYNKIKKPAAAIKALKVAAKVADDSVDYIYLTLAFEYQNMGKLNEAIRYIKRALDENPGNEEAIYELGYCYEQLNQPEKSIAFYKKFIDDNPYSCAAWYNLGNAYNQKGLYEKAIEAFDYALAIKDDFTSAYFNKANTYSKMKQFHKAIETFRETLEFDEEDVVTFFFIGECYEKMEDFDNALFYYKKSVDLDPEFAEGWLGIGVIMDFQDRLSEGIHYIKKALALEENNPDYWYIFAQVQQNLGLLEEAGRAYRKVADLDSTNVDVWLDHSEMYFSLEEFDKAIEIISEGVENHPGSAELYYRMVAYLLLLGHENDAQDMLYNALHINYDKHKLLFDYLPESKNREFVLDLIESHKAPH